MRDPAASLTKLLCSHGGRLPRDQLSGLLQLPPEQIEQILQEEPQKFPVVGELVLARSPVRICPKYLKGESEEKCDKLHLCRDHLQGECTRPCCSFFHKVLSDHNQTVLKANNISELDEDELKVLLFQNDDQLLPEVCEKYLHDFCDLGKDCWRLHVCGDFIRGGCRRPSCRLSHDLLGFGSDLFLLRCGMSEVLVQNFQMICAVKHNESLKSLRGDGRKVNERGGRESSVIVRPRKRKKSSQDVSKRKSKRRRHPAAGASSRAVSESGVIDLCLSSEDDDDDQCVPVRTLELSRTQSSSCRTSSSRTVSESGVIDLCLSSEDDDWGNPVEPLKISGVQHPSMAVFTSSGHSSPAISTSSVHSLPDAVTPYKHPLLTVSTSSVHPLLTVSTSSVHLLPAVSTSFVHLLPAVSISSVHPSPTVSTSTVPPLPAVSTSSVQPLPAVSTSSVHPLLTVSTSSVPPLPAVSTSAVHLLPAVSTSFVHPLPAVSTSSVHPLPAVSTSSVPPLPAVSTSSVHPLPTVSTSSVPPLPAVSTPFVHPLPAVSTPFVHPLPAISTSSVHLLPAVSISSVQLLPAVSTPFVHPLPAVSTSVQTLSSVSTSSGHPLPAVSTSSGHPLPAVSTSSVHILPAVSTPFVHPLPAVSTSFMHPLPAVSTSSLQTLPTVSTSSWHPLPVSSTSFGQGLYRSNVQSPLPVDALKVSSAFKPVSFRTVNPSNFPTPFSFCNEIVEDYRPLHSGHQAERTSEHGTTYLSPKRQTDEVPEICLSHLWKYCKLEGSCPDMHYYLPYRWQFYKGSDWEDISNMEEVEKSFCDPKVDSCRDPWIDFLTMRSGMHPVRRLSTVSSVMKPPEYVLTTEWLWYWKDQHGTWIQYDHDNMTQVRPSILSPDLENVYLADPTAVLPLIFDSHEYEISFREMKLKNVQNKTEKDVRRRPRFLSFEDVKLLRGSTKSAPAPQPLLRSSATKSDIYPQTWDPGALPEIGCAKVRVSDTSSEFMEIVSTFMKTLRGHVVKNVWRLQNPYLWKVFQLQKEQMKKVNREQSVKEIQLFHGTGKINIDAICNQNFDWRLCGSHGCTYGQGSYFARDAEYSHKYSTPTLCRTRMMFVARVLVGDYVVGNRYMKRPPLRPGSSTQCYDSCVDNVRDPSIFVVFEKHQVYPEYLLEYEEENRFLSDLLHWPI